LSKHDGSLNIKEITLFTAVHYLIYEGKGEVIPVL